MVPSVINSQSFLHPSRFSILVTKNQTVIAAVRLGAALPEETMNWLNGADYVQDSPARPETPLAIVTRASSTSRSWQNLHAAIFQRRREPTLNSQAARKQNRASKVPRETSGR